MRKFHYISLLFLSAFTAVSAQTQTKDTVVTRNVTVEREYVPVVKNAGKINSTPQSIEPKEIRLEAEYSDLNLPLPIGSNIHTLPSARLFRQIKPVKDGYAQIGLGTYPNTLVDFAYPLVKKSDMQLDFTLNHRGAFGRKLYTKSQANLLFDKQFEVVDFYAGLYGGHDYFKYYGSIFDRNGGEIEDVNSVTSLQYEETGVDFVNEDRKAKTVYLDNDAETFLKTGIFLGLRSKEEPYEWHYGAKVAYDLFNSHFHGINEHIVGLDGNLSLPFDDDRMGVDLSYRSMIYDAAAPLNMKNAHMTLSLNPYYDLMRNEKWYLRLGMNATFSFANDQVIFPSPDIRFDWKIVPEWVAMYGGLTGSYTLNNFNKIFNENPYLFTDTRVEDTYSPFAFFAGFKIKPFNNFLVDLYVNYRYLNNQYFFVNKKYAAKQVPNISANDTVYNNQFDVVYSEAMHFKSGIRLSYNYQNRLNLQFKGAYNGWDVYTEDKAWNLPAWEMDFSAGFNVTDELAFSFNLFYEGDRYAKIANRAELMDPKVDVNIGASYVYLDWLSFFARVNNLLNNKYQNFYGYEAQGLNVMVGASLSF